MLYIPNTHQDDRLFFLSSEIVYSN